METPAKEQFAELKTGDVVLSQYLIKNVLKEDTKGNVYKAIYVSGILNWGVCILKEAKVSHALDKHGRTMLERLKWQYKLQQAFEAFAPVAKPISLFEYRGNLYMAMQFLRGQSLEEFMNHHERVLNESLNNMDELGKSALDYLKQILFTIKKLHEHGYVHRDITPGNFIIKGKSVFLIDVELAYSMNEQYPSPPFELGTEGYMSPEQRKSRIPVFDEDIYAIGALLFRYFTTIHPSKLNIENDNELKAQLEFCIHDSQISSIIYRAMSGVERNRPSIDEINAVIANYGRGNKKIVTSSPDNSVIQSAIDALMSPLMVDENGWFSENIYAKSTKTFEKVHYPFFNRGSAGVLYLLSKVHKFGYQLNGDIDGLVKKSLDQYDSLPDDNGGLHFGSGGIALSLAEVYSSGLIMMSPEKLEYLERLLLQPVQGINYKNGLSGKGMSALYCVDRGLDIKVPLSSWVKEIVSCQLKDGSWPQLQLSKIGKNASSFSTGVAGIVYFLLSYGEIYNDLAALASAQRGLQWLRKNPPEINNSLDHWWCKGIGGISLAFMKGYTIFKQQVYKEACSKVLSYYNDHILYNNLGQCHGLSGLGEIYLEGWQTFRDDIWLQRADWIATVLSKLSNRHPQYGNYWYPQRSSVPTADFMVGNAGIIHFLLRVQYPDQVKFPTFV